MFLQLVLQYRLRDEALHFGTQRVSLSSNALSKFNFTFKVSKSFFIRNLFESFQEKAVTNLTNRLIQRRVEWFQY